MCSTLEDILEEIVGEIHDEYDENEEDFIKEIDEREYMIEGSTNLDDLNDRLDLQLESEDYDSLLEALSLNIWTAFRKKGILSLPKTDFALWWNL